MGTCEKIQAYERLTSGLNNRNLFGSSKTFSCNPTKIACLFYCFS